MITKNSLRAVKANFKGTSVDSKILVLESDDWGAIRTPSVESLKRLDQLGVRVNNCHYTKYDSLAAPEDLTALFEVLRSVKDNQENHPILTANAIVGNPNFKKIEESGFKEYHWDDFRDALMHQDNSGDTYRLWQEGMERKLFHPQFHGREHLNISRWMKALKEGDRITLEAFKLGICSLSGHIVPKSRGSHLAAYDVGENEKLFEVNEIVKEGLEKFKEIFGYSSKSMIAPNYVWNDDVEEAGFDEGVSYIQSSTAQRLPNEFGAKTKIKRHYMGQRNTLGQMYLLRNCHFEPASNPSKDWVDSCLREVNTAFKMRKPAIISTHRVNFVGRLSKKNRDRGLNGLSKLLATIVKKWPEVRFMTSDQLGDYITNKSMHED